MNLHDVGKQESFFDGLPPPMRDSGWMHFMDRPPVRLTADLANIAYNEMQFYARDMGDTVVVRVTPGAPPQAIGDAVEEATRRIRERHPAGFDWRVEMIGPGADHEDPLSIYNDSDARVLRYRWREMFPVRRPVVAESPF